MADTYKYSSSFQNLKACPPVDCKEVTKNAFRFIFEDTSHINNFNPVLLITPARINDTAFDKDHMKCSGYALSMHDTLINSVTAYQSLRARIKNIANKLGTHVAEIALEPIDGKATNPSQTGHFDFYEYTTADLSRKIINKTPIP